MKGSEFIDEYWKENKLALGVKDQWGEIMEAYHKTEALKMLNKLKHPMNSGIMNRHIDRQIELLKQ